MKKILLLCLTTLLCSATMWAQSFTAENDDGIIIFYSSVDSDKYEYACEITGARDDDVEELNIPSTVDYNGDTYTVVGIGDLAFEDYDRLIKLETPSTLEYINEGAFDDCRELEEITLGKSVEYISDDVFRGCRNIEIIYSLNPVPPVCEESAFQRYEATLYVPKNAIYDYMNDEVWSQFYIEAYVEETLLTVITAAATDVFQTTATLHGTVTGGEVEITEQGFEYWTENRTILTVNAEGEEMTVQIDNLSPGTTYAFHAYAQCGEDTAYGDDLYFTTMCDYDLLSDGIYYRITSTSNKTCSVCCLYPTSDNGDVYTGEINIPETVEIDGETYTVTGIDDSAFYYCRNLTSVTIPETVTSIGTYAFYYCSSLTSVTIPSSVTSIGATAFGFCGLTELTIPDNITSIGTYAFCNNTSLLKAKVGDGMKTIPEGMFYNCTKVEEVEVPDDITSIGTEGFCNCSSLKEFIIPETVTTIGNSAFMLCSSLTSMVVPDGVTSLNYTFDQCTALEEVTLGKNLKTLGQEVFYHCSSLKEISFPETLTSIGSYCFVDCTSLTELIIPDAVTSLGSESFDGCSGLTDVKFGSGLKEIGGGAFGRCEGLSSLTFPDALESIGYGAFDRCTGLEEVTFGSGLKVIDGEAFLGCIGLTSLEFPDALESIGYEAFDRCTGLEEVTFGSGLKEIGSDAFAYCTSLPSITIPSSVETIGSYAFAYCDILSDVTMNEGLKEIGSDAFYYCEALTLVDIPNTVESLGSYAFAYCSSLNDVILPSGLKEINSYTFYHCEALTSVDIPNTVECLGYGAFQYCSSLVKIKIPNSVTTLDYSVFQGCSGLIEVTLGKSVESFGQTVFQNCSSLAKIYSLNQEPASAPYANVFDNIYDRCVLYIPLGSYEAYETKKPDYSSSSKLWADSFYKIIELADVETLEATDVTETSATLRGTIEVGELCESTTSKGFEIWEEANPDNLIIRLVSGDSFTCALDGLSSETTYLYHAFVTTATSSSYGDDVEFTTEKVFISPTVQTFEPSDITSSSALIKGYVEAGTEEITEQGFEYWTGNEEPESITSDDNVMALILAGLTPETTYTYRAFAVTDSGTTYGEDVEFTTLEDTSTGINGIHISIDDENVEGIYSTSGQKLNSTVKGVNIIRYSDGSVKKIYVK